MFFPLFLKRRKKIVIYTHKIAVEAILEYTKNLIQEKFMDYDLDITTHAFSLHIFHHNISFFLVKVEEISSEASEFYRISFEYLYPEIQSFK